MRCRPLREQCNVIKCNVILFLSNRVVKAMAEFHTVKLPENVLKNAQNERFYLLNAVLGNSTIKQEIISTLEHHDYKLGLVHGDFHLGNILINAHYNGPPFPPRRNNIHDKTVHLIDYEHTHYGWIVHDWAKIIGRIAKSRNFRTELLEVYLKNVAELEGRSTSDVTRADVEKFNKQIEAIENTELFQIPRQENFISAQLCNKGSSKM